MMSGDPDPGSHVVTLQPVGQGRGGSGRGPRFGKRAAAASVALFIVGVTISGLQGRPAVVPTRPTFAIASATAARTVPPQDLREFANYSDLEFEYPSNWHLFTVDYGERNLAAAVGTVDKAGSCQVGAFQGPECALDVQLEPGQVLVVIGRESAGAGTIFDSRPQGGWTDQIDGMPAWRGEPTIPSDANADDGERWLIAMPFSVSNVYTVDAIFRGPNLPLLRSQVEALVRSITLGDLPEALPSGPGSDTALANAARVALDQLDRDAREYAHTNFYGCFPRLPGTVNAMILRDGPQGLLPGPVPVKCSVEVEPTEVRLWQMNLTVEWPHVPDSVGSYHQRVWFGTAGQVIQTEGYDPGFPVTALPPSPPPPSVVAKIHAGSIIEALHEQILTGNPADASPIGQAFVGQHLYVVAGPVRRDALWFLVQWQQSRSAPPSLGWMQIYPLNPFVFRLIDPPCPRSIPDLATIVGMIPAERLLCFGDRELTFAPVVITELGTGVEVDGQPIWLAPEPNLAMYDSSGPEGLNGSIPVYLSPDTNGAFLPFGGLLAVKGHFDDPAARGCHRVVRSEQVSPPLTLETPAAQVLRCRENFVITSAHEIPVADGSPVP